MIHLLSSDNELFEVPVKVISLSEMLMDTVDETVVKGPIYLPNVTGPVLAKVIEYCTYHVKALKSEDGAANTDRDLEIFDAHFVQLDPEILLDLSEAASYLYIKSLIDLTCQTMASMIKGKTIEEIRSILNIQNDYTLEEEMEVRKENAWAFV